MVNEVFPMDRRQLRATFERAASSYDAAAGLQREIGTRLLERLELTTLQPARILDLGCGTGDQLDRLSKRYPRAQVLGTDLAANMLAESRRKQGWFKRRPLVCADALQLPFSMASFDLIYSNLMLQWCQDLYQVFGQLRRVLRPHGLLLFSTFGPDTLKELRSAWQAVDDYNHVNQFIDMHDIGDTLIHAGFVEPVMDVEHITVTYEEVLALFRDLKSIGAHNVTRGRAHSLLGPGHLRKLEGEYEQYRREGRIPATYEVIYGTAWTSAYMPSNVLTAGELQEALHGSPQAMDVE